MATKKNGRSGGNPNRPDGGDHARRPEDTASCRRCGAEGPPRLDWSGPHLGLWCRACGTWLRWLPQSIEWLKAAPPLPARRRLLAYDASNPVPALLETLADVCRAHPEVGRAFIRELIAEREREGPCAR